MPDVDEIIERLRGNALRLHSDPPDVGSVSLADAEAAILDAVDARTAEIVDALLGEQWGIAREGEVGRFAADLIARRFPNGGTNDAS